MIKFLAISMLISLAITIAGILTIQFELTTLQKMVHVLENPMLNNLVVDITPSGTPREMVLMAFVPASDTGEFPAYLPLYVNPDEINAYQVSKLDE